MFEKQGSVRLPGVDDLGVGDQGERVDRYRCTACGNLTRFDVITNRRTRSFHHYTVGGDLEIEDSEVLSEVIEEVNCRWCGTGTDVVAEADPPDPGAHDRH